MGNDSSSSSGAGGLGLPGTVLVVFVVLKLVGVIDWSWWWVLSPIWITLILVLPIYLAVWIVYVVHKRRDDDRRHLKDLKYLKERLHPKDK